MGIKFIRPSVCGSPWTEFLPDSIYFSLVLSFPGSDYSEETEGGKKEMARKRNTYLLSTSQVLNSVFHESMNSSKTWVTLH